jgi:hypothetical protein
VSFLKVDATQTSVVAGKHTSRDNTLCSQQHSWVRRSAALACALAERGGEGEDLCDECPAPSGVGYVLELVSGWKLVGA